MFHHLLTDGYWYGRFLFYRGLFLTYFIAFLVAFRQFIPLCGENGILPFPARLERISVPQNPTLLAVFDSDTAVSILSISGLFLSLAGLSGAEWLGFWWVSSILFLLWLFYLSLMNAGGLFYGYGWESFLVETGFLAVFMGSAGQEVSLLLQGLVAWLLFRVMFGAGLIKLRGDECWRNLTCMDYHYETQPMPNPLSWFAHHLPKGWHKFEVLGNHVVELLVPILYFLPQPYGGTAAVITIVFQGWLMLTGNFSWLNFLTIVVAFPLLPDGYFLPLGLKPDSLTPVPYYQHYAVFAYTAVVILLSYWPVKNFLSNRQVMNAGYDPFNLVNTYGAFGSITKKRFELVVEGRVEGGEWQTYEFRGKPTDQQRRPPQWAPYHLRLDWQMWFAAMRRRPRYWLLGLMRKLFEDNQFHELLHDDPFRESEGPHQLRISRYRYSFTEPGERRKTGRWWTREYLETVFPPMEEHEVDRQLRGK